MYISVPVIKSRDSIKSEISPDSSDEMAIIDKPISSIWNNYANLISKKNIEINLKYVLTIIYKIMISTILLILVYISV